VKRYLKKVVFYSKSDRTEETAEDIPDGAEPLADIGGQGTLYIVDTKQDLDFIKSKGLPVLAWLHEENRDQDLSAAAYAVEDPHALDIEFYEKVYRREMHIPWEILETDRCLVREMVPGDAAAFERIYEEPEICRYMKDFHGDAAGEAAYIREYTAHYRFYEYGVWSIVLKETGEVIGRAGFSEGDANVSVDKTEVTADMVITMGEKNLPCLGYMIGVPWQRQGLAYEVCRAILQYAKEELGFEAVQLQVEAENTASIRLAEKLNFPIIRNDGVTPVSYINMVG